MKITLLQQVSRELGHNFIHKDVVAREVLEIQKQLEAKRINEKLEYRQFDPVITKKQRKETEQKGRNIL